MTGNNERIEQELDSLFAAYREACPDRDVSAGFMPGLWEKIEARQRTTVLLRRWTQGFVGLAAAASLAMMALMISPSQSVNPLYLSTYIDQLAEEQSPERLLIQDIAQVDLPDQPVLPGDRRN